MTLGQVGKRFRLEREIGVGGMGRVFRAVDEQTSQIVAVKQILDGSDPQARSRFARECEVLSNYAHPLLVRHVAHDVSEAEPWLAMEWLEGEDLASRLSRGPVDTTTALALIDDLANAVGHLHAHGIVHRDLKPSNAFLVNTPDGLRAKLIDLGTAYETSPDATAITKTGSFIGTPLYVSPEQAQGLRADARSDIWSLGVILFEMLAGVSPFEADFAIAALAKILMGNIPRLAHAAPSVPEWLDRIVARAVERDLDQRYQSTRDFRAAFAGASETIAAGVVSAHSTSRDRPQEQRTLLALLCAPSSASRLEAAVRDLNDRAVEMVVMRGGLLLARFGSVRASSDDPFFCLDVARQLSAADPESRVVFSLVRAGGTSTNDVYDRCASLLESALPGEAVSDEETLAVCGAVTIRATRGRLRVLDANAPDDARDFADQVPIVGRETELGRLEGLWRSLRDEERPGAALVVGEAGMGKTRLVSAFLDRVKQTDAAPRVLRWSGNALQSTTPFAMAGVAISRDAGLGAVREPFEKELLLAKWARSELGDRADEDLPFLCIIVGIEPSAPKGERWQRAGESVERMHAELANVWAAWLRKIDLPIILVIEDAHWADAASMALSTQLLGQDDLTALVLVTSRPEIKERSAPLFEGLPIEELSLKPLSSRASARLIESLGESQAFTDTRIAAIISRAGGHPLFLRELMRSQQAGEADLPLSVEFIVQRRLDALTPSAREACRVAAVFGDACWGRAIELVVGRGCKAELAELVAADFLARRVPSSLLGEDEFVFRHAVFFEATYRTIPEDQARRFHAAARNWLELNMSPKRSALLAHHAYRAGDSFDAANLWAEAAEESSRVGDFDAAARLYCRALDLGIRAQIEPSVLGVWQARLADLLVALRNIPDAVSVSARALEVLRASADPSLRFAAGLAHASVLASASLLDEAETAFIALDAETKEDPKTRASLYLARGRAAHLSGDFLSSVVFLKRVDVDQLTDNQRFSTHLSRAVAMSAAGDQVGAKDEFDAAERWTPDDPRAAVTLAKTNGLRLYFAGDLQQSIEVNVRASELAHAAGLGFDEAITLHNAADAALILGQWIEGRMLLDSALAMAKATSYEPLIRHNEALLKIISLTAHGDSSASEVDRHIRWLQSRALWLHAMSLECQLAQALTRVRRFDEAYERATNAKRMSAKHGFHAGVLRAEALLDSLARESRV